MKIGIASYKRPQCRTASTLLDAGISPSDIYISVQTEDDYKEYSDAHQVNVIYAPSDCAGFDIVDFYRKYSVGTGYLRLNRKIKEKYIRNMQELCHSLGMRFYVSDAHFKECCDNCSCCALPKEWDYSRGNFSAALQIAKKTGSVRWSDIEKDMYFLEFPYDDAQGFNTISTENKAKFRGMTMKDYLHYLWNNPKRGQSPYKLFERVLMPDGLDDNGDIIYKYNEKVTFEKCGKQTIEQVRKTRV